MLDALTALRETLSCCLRSNNKSFEREYIFGDTPIGVNLRGAGSPCRGTLSGGQVMGCPQVSFSPFLAACGEQKKKQKLPPKAYEVEVMVE